uniref:Uncharacterized protein n=1 Tax=Populus alba TaxID=43335 RepID=A0A4U5Q1V7_POPAL|nr:hypothetical protein D5086_0000147190 [Populus alba]
MVARHRSNQNWQNHPKTNNGTDKSTYKCTQCNQTGHTKSQRFELVGYPEWWDHSRDTRKKNSKRPSTAAMVETKIEDDVAEKASALVLTANNGGENQKEIQTLDYDGLNYTHNSDESESLESSNLDVGNLDQSGITLDSSGDVSQAGPVNHEVGELDLSGISLDTSEDESLEAEDVAPLSKSNPCIIPNQSSAADVPDMVSEPFLKQLPQRHTRGNSLFVILGEDVLPERINKKGTLNVDLLSPEKGSLRKSVAETHEETETTDSDPINATLH